MVSFDLDGPTLDRGQVDQVDLYLTGTPEHAGRAYAAVGDPATFDLRNSYRFLDPKREIDILPRWRALVEGVAEAHGATLASLTLDRRRCIYHFELGESSVDVVLTARTEEGPALLRTASFDLHYRNIEGPAREPLAALVRSVAEAVRDRDRGGMKLDERKGLIGAEALRRSALRKRPPSDG